METEPESGLDLYTYLDLLLSAIPESPDTSKQHAVVSLVQKARDAALDNSLHVKFQVIYGGTSSYQEFSINLIDKGTNQQLILTKRGLYFSIQFSMTDSHSFDFDQEVWILELHTTHAAFVAPLN